MAQAERVTVEFFGIPRLRAGRAELDLPLGTVGETLAAVERTCPGLTGLVQSGKLAPQYLLSINGQRFDAGPGETLRGGDRLLLLSADAGG